MDTEHPAHCPACGWPVAETFQLVSRHQTSEGVIVYSRCPCGRLQVRGGAAGPMTSRYAAEPASSALAVTRSTRPAGWLAAVLVVAVAVVVAVTLPVGALLACMGLATVVGALAYAWAWLTTGSSWEVTLRTAMRATLLGGASAIVLTGLVGLLGPASVPLITALYAVLAVSFWLTRSPGRRPC
jgi:hypothetical protein